MKYQECVQDIKNELSDIYPDGEINSLTWLLFEHFEGLTRVNLHMKYPDDVSENTVKSIEKAVQSIKNNHPIQYVLGRTTFFDLTLEVETGVLIPRPETEELVNWIIDDLKEEKQLKILDIGTGSGCIAIVLYKYLNCHKAVGADVSKEALNIARKNNKLNKTKVRFKKWDILEKKYKVHKRKWDLIVSNPPYVMEKEKTEMHSNVLDYEPHLALFVDDENPLIFYKAIGAYAKRNLNKNGTVYVEINEAFGTETLNIFVGLGFSEVVLKKDLFDKERMIKAIL